jgi:hypothetical protein
MHRTRPNLFLLIFIASIGVLVVSAVAWRIIDRDAYVRFSCGTTTPVNACYEEGSSAIDNYWGSGGRKDCSAGDRRKHEIPDCGRYVNGRYHEWSWVAAGKTVPSPGWTPRKDQVSYGTVTIAPARSAPPARQSGDDRRDPAAKPKKTTRTARSTR